MSNLDYTLLLVSIHPLKWLGYLLTWQLIDSLIGLLLSNKKSLFGQYLLAISYTFFGGTSALLNTPKEQHNGEYEHHFETLLIIARYFSYITTLAAFSFLLSTLLMKLLVNLGVFALSIASGIAFFGIAYIIIYLLIWVSIVSIVTIFVTK